MALITDYGIKGYLENLIADFPVSEGIQAATYFSDSDLAEGQAELIGWLATVPSMREWIKERLVSDPMAFSHQITNRKFESSIKVPLRYVNNDKTGNVMEMLGNMGALYPLWRIELLCALINLGTSVNSFDGVSFFNASHSWGLTGTFSNLVNSAANGSSTAITAIEAANALNLLIETMKKMPDDQGRLIKNEAMKKVVIAIQAGTQNAAAIRTAINSVGSTIMSATGPVVNPLSAQDVQIMLVSSGLITTGQTKISAFRAASDRGRGLIFQENKAERMISVLSDPNTEFVFRNDAWAVGLKTVGNAGFGLPNDAVQMTLV